MQNCKKWLLATSCLKSVCMEQLSSHWMDFSEIWYFTIFRKNVTNIQVSLKSNKKWVLYIKTKLHFWSYLAQFFSKWETFDKSCTENQNTHFKFNNLFLKKMSIYEILWKINVELDRPQTTIWHMHTNCWICKAKNTHSESATLQQWSYKHASVLHVHFLLSTTLIKRCRKPLSIITCQTISENFTKGFLITQERNQRLSVKLPVSLELSD